MEKPEINKRIMQLIDYLDTSNNQFAKSIGISSSRISSIATFRNKPDSDFLQSIAEVYSNVSMDWLLTGRGSMIKEPFVFTVEELEAEYMVRDSIYHDVINRKKAKIEKLNRKIERMTSEVKLMEKRQ
jgi:transcriptional regulator with XRE-family HTH domain